MIANKQYLLIIVTQLFNKIEFCQYIFASVSILIIFVAHLLKQNLYV
jgi:hypothetical protein